MPALGKTVIQARNLRKDYRSGDATLNVLAGINLEVREGERLAVIGESGSGKSTLLHLLGGLDSPTSGEIFFGDKQITHLKEEELAEFRNRELGFVWQIHYLLPEFTALENVMMPLLIRGTDREEAASRAMDRLAEVGLKPRATHRAGELSGGEQQRVVLARALIGKPRFLLADEPTGNLDTMTGDRIFGLLTDLHQHHRLTSVLVTHNVSFAKRCDRILRLEVGDLVPCPVPTGGGILND
jgi:lipoprotein-releasing system ATP-binding protein